MFKLLLLISTLLLTSTSFASGSRDVSSAFKEMAAKAMKESSQQRIESYERQDVKYKKTTFVIEGTAPLSEEAPVQEDERSPLRNENEKSKVSDETARLLEFMGQ